jgi:tetratricopeptide (TPR) repeat protein
MMVNGEPYAQVTLRPGDVLELGHVKLQFLAPGQPTPPGLAAASGITQETRAVSPRSSSRLLPALGVLAVLVLGGAGYALLRVRQSAPPRAAAEPAPRQTDPEAVLKRQLGQAREAIEALDWPRAQAVLQTTRIENGAFTPEVQALLAQLKAEQPYRAALEAAARQLDLGDEAQARAQLETAAPTALLAARYQELEARRAALATEAARRPVAAAPAPPARPDPARARTDEAEALYQESRELVKAQQLEAAVVRLDRCIKLAPLYHACYKALGSAHAKIASRDGNEAERAKGRKFYERYLELAPPDDKDVAKVRGILEKAAADQPQ